MRIALVGWGIENQSAYRYFGPDHEYLIVSESRPTDLTPDEPNVKVQFIDADRPIGMVSMVEDLSYMDGVDKCNLIIYQPTARQNLKKHFGDDPAFWSKAKTVQHIFFENVKTKNLIGITGTKGKGTTSTLLSKLLEADGKTVFLAGNIGKSVLDIMPDIQGEDWVVLELSNFQLQDFPYSPHIGVCLMITAEHLDWHANMNEYVDAKSHLFRNQTPQDVAIYFADNQYSREIASYSKGIKVPFYKPPGGRVRQDGMIVIGDQETEIINKREVKLLGEHNLQNICAALTAFWQVSQNTAAAQQVLTAFSGLEHRLEFVRNVGGVDYYDDSFGTTPETAIVAMKAFDQPKILVLGGSDKGIPFDGLTELVASSNTRHVITIGKTGSVIANQLREKGFNNISEDLNTMPEIVDAAKKVAQPGDVVLLSCGCASFGLFKDYKDRGNQFKAAVNVLA
jgi:UDP-N-acetylmuramoylalanine--D-glutamate ligase